MANLVYRNKKESLSFEIQKRFLVVFFIMLLVTVLVFILSLSAGSSWISPVVVVSHLIGLGSGEHDFVIDTLRLPRVLLAFLVGMALGVSGLLLQAIVRNPLAAPDIIGVTGGAAVGAIAFLVLFSGTLSLKWIPVAAIIGASIVSVLVYVLSWKKGVTPIRLILIGIGIAAAAKALVMMLLILTDIGVASKAYVWLTGSVYGASWSNVQAMLPWVFGFLFLAFVLSRVMNVKELGDDVSAGLGVNVQLYRFLLLFVSVALAGSAVAFAGGISFVGLIAPHIARKIIGRSYGGLIPITALIGGLLVMIADLLARTAFLPLDVPAGVFTAGIGAPFFIYLLYKKRNM
jgi:iron complex transport system permease protein